MKKVLFIIASLALVASCAKNEQIGTKTGEGKIFTAVIEQGPTKTTLTSENKVNWVAGDLINVNGAGYSAEPMIPASKATFRHISGNAPLSGPYTAIYPADLYDTKTGCFAFPEVIAYKAGQLNTPMYAWSGKEELSFKNISGVIQLSLYSCEEDVVKTITVTANESITGPFKVILKEDGTPSVDFSGEGKSVTIDCGEGVKLSAEPTEFYIPIPEGRYSEGMRITVDNGEKTIFDQETVMPVEIFRNTIYHLDFGKLDALYKNTFKQMALLIGSKQPGKEYNPYRVLFNMCGDDVCAADAYNNGYGFIAQLNDFTYTPDNEVILNCYTNFYKAIDVCNKFISEYPNSPDPKTRDYTAQVRTLRAWLYFTLATGWGNPPLVTEYPAPEYPGNTPQETIYGWCEKELSEVIGDLTERFGSGDREGATKVTRGFAQALLGKVFLFDNKPNEAAQFLKPVVESSNYAIVPGERFFDLFHIEGNGCEEKIFELDMSNVPDYGYAGTETKLWACNDKCFVAAPWGAYQASESAWGLGLPDYFAHNFLENDGDSYRRKTVMLTSDEVFYDGYLTSYNIEGFKDLTLEEKQFHPGIGVKAEGLYGQCDMLPRKLIVSRNDAPSGSNLTNFTVMRLGEAQLLFAEACIRTGNNAEAKKYINNLQFRAGSKTIFEEVSLENLKKEKMYELWMECCRWQDIMRWNDEVGIINLKTAGTKVCKAEDAYTTSGGSNPHRLIYTPLDVKDNGSFNIDKHRYFPYPAAVVNSNPNIQQNPNW